MRESDRFHVEVPRKGSIAASRDVERDEMARRGSVALARDLELGEGRRMSVVYSAKDNVNEEVSFKTDVSVRCEEVRAGSSEGMQGIDYGTM